MGPVAAVIGAVATVGGTVAAQRNAKKSQRAQEAAAAKQQQQQTLATRRSRRQAIRQAQITRAQAMASAGASGAFGSSAATGGIGSVGSQLGGQMGYSTAMSGLSGDINAYNMQASQYNARAQTWGSVANLGMSAFTAFGGPQMVQGATQGLTAAPQPTWGNAPMTQVNAALGNGF